MKTFTSIPAILLVLVLTALTGEAQGIRGVTRRTVLSPAPGLQPSPSNITAPLSVPLPPPGSPGGPPSQPAAAPARPVVVYQYKYPTRARADKFETDRKVLEFHKRRAVEGSPHAQYSLGIRYLEGNGVEKNETTAREWLKKSAQNGSEQAKKKLAELDRERAASASREVKKE